MTQDLDIELMEQDTDGARQALRLAQAGIDDGDSLKVARNLRLADKLVNQVHRRLLEMRNRGEPRT